MGLGKFHAVALLLDSYFLFTCSLTLADRTFKTLDFYREFQDNLTPAGLAFFQADWDDSVQKFYHKTLGTLLYPNSKCIVYTSNISICRYERTNL